MSGSERAASCLKVDLLLLVTCQIVNFGGKQYNKEVVLRTKEQKQDRAPLKILSPQRRW